MLIDLMKTVAEEWKNLDATKKDNLVGQFKKDWSKYLEDCKKYDEMLSPGEKDKIKIEKEEAKILQAKRILKKVICFYIMFIFFIFVL